MSPLLTITPENEKKVQEMIAEVSQDSPKYWAPGQSEQFYVPVDDGHIRVFHWKPEKPVSVRPVVFVPGWGVIPRGYDDYYEILHNRVECYYIETREKSSSRIQRRGTDFSMPQKARDVQAVLDYIGLNGDKDFVLQAPCWGAAVLLNGLYYGSIKAPTVITIDPMHALWFPKWFLRLFAPVIPVPVFRLFRPIIRHAMIGNMKEPVQKKRATDVANEAEIWKWKRAAIHVADYELFDFAEKIDHEVFVVNGTEDKVHKQDNYPKIASLLPKGRFIYMKTGEEQRERMMGLIALEFSRVRAEDGVPRSLKIFEKEISR